MNYDIKNNNLTRAEALLIDLNKGLKVSRHAVLRNRNAIALYLEEPKYKHLKNKVRDLIESARESY